MVRGILKFVAIISILSTPVLSQFGVPRSGSFEELNEMAKDQMGGGSMADLANLDYDELMKMVQETMQDPSMMEYIDGLSSGMGEAMEQLSKMSPEEIQMQMKDNLQAMSSPDMLNSVLDQKEDVLNSLSDQGLITEEQKEEFLNDPEKFQETMAEAFGEMSKILSDPEAIDAVTKVMKGVSDIMKDPNEALSQLAQAFSEGLDDDDKIEEARQQLIADPENAGNPMLASLFEDDEMQEILRDPVKWREQVKKGQDMLTELGNDAAVTTGAGTGEL